VSELAAKVYKMLSGNVRTANGSIFIQTPGGTLEVNHEGAWMVGEGDARLGDQSGALEAINYAERLFGLKED
jgi:hypothetical protein